MSNPRSARVAERIHEIVASLVINRLKDPRLELVTITDVRVTGDLQHATVFYTVYGGQKKLAAAGKALASAKGLIRSQVGGQLGLRLTPTIEFIADALPETARSIEDALVAARNRDEQIAKAARGAVPAGEADPYRRPRQEAAEAEGAEAEGADGAPGGAAPRGAAVEPESAVPAVEPELETVAPAADGAGAAAGGAAAAGPVTAENGAVEAETDPVTAKSVAEFDSSAPGPAEAASDSSAPASASSGATGGTVGVDTDGVDGKAGAGQEAADVEGR